MKNHLNPINPDDVTPLRVSTLSKQHCMVISKEVDFITLFRETAMRGQLAFPYGEQELEWFDEGMTSDFTLKLINALNEARP